MDYPLVITGAVLAIAGLVALARPLSRRIGDQNCMGDAHCPFRAQLHEHMVMNTFDGMVIQDMKGRIEWANPAYEALSGYSLAEIEGKNPLSFMLPEDQTPSAVDIEAFRFDCARLGARGALTRINKRKDGTLFHNDISLIITPPIQDLGQKALLICRDVTKQIETEARLKAQRDNHKALAAQDALTGLANRGRLIRRLESLLGTPGHQFALMQIDLDRFKHVNDTAGHAAGDAVLVHVAQSLSSICETRDLACRIGGDEFVVILSDSREGPQVEARAHAILEEIGKPIRQADRDLRIGCSIGISFSGARDIRPDTILVEADQALYAAKGSGRGQIRIFDDVLRARYSTRKRIVESFRAQVETGEFEYMLEPAIDAETGAHQAFRAQALWRDPDGTLVDPQDLDSLQEAPNALHQHTIHLVRFAARATKALNQPGGAPMLVMAYLPSKQPLKTGLADILNWAIEQEGADPNNLVFGVDEALLCDSNSENVAVLHSFRDAGLGLAICGFGANHGAFRQLSDLPIKIVRLSESLTCGIADNHENQILCSAVTLVCKNLGLYAAALGITDAREAQVAVELGCDRLAGTWVSPPVNIDGAIALLAQGPFTGVDVLQLRRRA